MHVTINRLDPNVPDPIESRRRAAGRLVRFAYGTTVFGVLAFFVVYFGAPFVFLSGPGTVTAPRYVVSLPNIVQVQTMNVVPGATVKAGQEIGTVNSPQIDGVLANYMNSLADIAVRRAELRVKLRVAQDTLASTRSYLDLTQETIAEIERTSAASLSYRVGMYRERAQALGILVTHEAEISESTAQLADLDKFSQQVRGHMDAIERSFAGGKVFAPIAGVVSTNVAHAGQSLVAGAPIAEILDASDIFVDWYIPNERLVDPRIDDKVMVLFGNRRIPGTIVDILPVSDVYAGRQPQFGGDRQSTQIARIRFNEGATMPALNSTVYVHMYYTSFTARIAEWLIWLIGLA
ncbi:HlyD family secretion protein [Mesorhizobium sp. P5_C1]